MRRALAMLLLFWLTAQAKSYWYPNIRTDVELESDGDALIRQTRTYDFEGSYSWAFVDLERTGADDILFHTIEESTDAGWRQISPLEVSRRTKSLYVKWGYEAENEVKSFRLSYTVRGVVKRWQDCAEFYWKLVEDEHEKVGRVEADIVLPGSSPSLLKAWVHSRARPGELSFGPGKDRVSIRQDGLPKNSFQEVRLVCESGLFARTSERSEKAYERILGEEKRNYLGSTLRAYVLLPLGLLLMLVLPVVLVIVFYVKYGREPKLTYEAIYEHEPPTDAPPLHVPGILSQKPGQAEKATAVFPGVFATLLRLAGKGWVSVQEIKQTLSTGYVFVLEKQGETEGLAAEEKAVLDLMFSRAARGRERLTDKEFREYGRANAATVRSTLADWFDSGAEWWEQKLGGPLLDPKSTRAYRTFSLLSFLGIALGVFLAITGLRQVVGGGPVGLVLPMLVGFAVLMIAGFAGRSVYRWTPEAYLEHMRWRKFKKFLTEFSAIEEAPIQLLGIREHYYVYAVVLGVAKEFLKNVGRLAQERGTVLAPPVWYVGATVMAGRGPDMAAFQQSIKNLTSFSTNFTGMMASFSPKSSSGGGFSGGGGGGGGGGSSGAG